MSYVTNEKMSYVTNEKSHQKGGFLNLETSE